MPTGKRHDGHNCALQCAHKHSHAVRQTHRRVAKVTERLAGSVCIAAGPAMDTMCARPGIDRHNTSRQAAHRLQGKGLRLPETVPALPEFLTILSAQRPASRGYAVRPAQTLHPGCGGSGRQRRDPARRHGFHPAPSREAAWPEGHPGADALREAPARRAGGARLPVREHRALPVPRVRLLARRRRQHLARGLRGHGAVLVP
jgi:hypothetical protein